MSCRVAGAGRQVCVLSVNNTVFRVLLNLRWHCGISDSSAITLVFHRSTLGLYIIGS